VAPEIQVDIPDAVWNVYNLYTLWEVPDRLRDNSTWEPFYLFEAHFLSFFGA
jgi:hypothetical protein